MQKNVLTYTNIWKYAFTLISKQINYKFTFINPLTDDEYKPLLTDTPTRTLKKGVFNLGFVSLFELKKYFTAQYKKMVCACV